MDIILAILRGIAKRIPGHVKTFYRIVLFVTLTETAFANTYTVTSVADAGAGTLRQAIINANANAGADTIVFNIVAGAGSVKTITVASLLPFITGQTFINGYSQPGSVQGANGSSRSIKIEIDGNGINSISAGRTGVSNTIDGFFRFASGSGSSSLCGIAVYNTGYGVEGIEIDPGTSGISGIHIWGNYIGLTAAGSSPASSKLNRDDALLIGDQSTPSGSFTNIFIGTDGNGVNDANEGNVFSNSADASNGGDGIQIGNTGSAYTYNNLRISGNYIGIAADGVTAAPNGALTGTNSFGFNGISITQGSNILIGSNGDGISDALERNIISGNIGSGIYVGDGSGHRITGNYIGTDKYGSSPIPNAKLATTVVGYMGILVRGAVSNTVIGFDDAIHTKAVAPEVRNVISGNWNEGIQFFNVTGSGNRVCGNYLGVTAGGNAPLGNGQANNTNISGAGIRVDNAAGVLIGTDADGILDQQERNVLCGAINGVGIYLRGGATGNIAAGNYIGVGADGITAIGNSNAGIRIGSSSAGSFASNNRIGSNDDGVNDSAEANIIAWNGTNKGTPNNRNGITIVSNSTSNSTGNRLSRNIFYNNIGLSIDLNDDLVTPNDGAVTLSGTASANIATDYPILTACSKSGNTLYVSGYVSRCNGSELVAGPTIAGARTIQFYKESNDGDQDGALSNSGCTRMVAHGEGAQYLGSITGVVNTFNTSFALVAGVSLLSSDNITAIAIDANGNTSEFGTRTLTGILPLTWQSFTASVGSTNNVLLQWSATSEANGQGFDIEKSADGISWRKIGYQAGNTATGGAVAVYHFTDLHPLPGNNYYRLKQLEADGSFQYSETRRVKFDNRVVITVFPNPVSSQLAIGLPGNWLNKPVFLELYNQAGQKILSQQAASAPSKLYIPVNVLPVGIYILKLLQPGKDPETKKIQVIHQ